MKIRKRLTKIFIGLTHFSRKISFTSPITICLIGITIFLVKNSHIYE